MTADVDVTVDIGDLGTIALVDQLSQAGFDLRMALDDDFLRSLRLLPLVHRPTAMPLDLLVASTKLHAEFLARARLVDAGGVRVPMMSPEDLVVTKVLAGRRKDLEDVRGVLREQPALDLERARALLAQLEVALENPGLLRRLARLVKDTRGT